MLGVAMNETQRAIHLLWQRTWNMLTFCKKTNKHVVKCVSIHLSLAHIFATEIFGHTICSIRTVFPVFAYIFLIVPTSLHANANDPMRIELRIAEWKDLQNKIELVCTLITVSLPHFAIFPVEHQMHDATSKHRLKMRFFLLNWFAFFSSVISICLLCLLWQRQPCCPLNLLRNKIWYINIIRMH